MKRINLLILFLVFTENVALAHDPKGWTNTSKICLLIGCVAGLIVFFLELIHTLKNTTKTKRQKIIRILLVALLSIFLIFCVWIGSFYIVFCV